MPRQDRGRSRSPLAGLNTRRISSALCGMVRYEKNRPQGLEVEDGKFSLDNLMEVWGERQGLTHQLIIDAVQAHMFQDQASRTLRYSMSEDDQGRVVIRVHPSRNQGKGRFGGGSDSRRGRHESSGGGQWWRNKYDWSSGGGADGNITDDEDQGATKKEPVDETWPASATKKNTTTIEAPSREKQTLFVGQFRKTKMCRFHETGRCRYGEKCPFAHSNDELEDLPDLRKTSICKNWQNGCCNFAADRCSFAHGKEELRKTPPFGRKKSQGEGLDRRDSFEGSDAYASTSEGYHGGSFESDRQSSSSFDEEPQTPTRQLAWDPLGLGHGEGRFVPGDFMLPDLMMPFNPMNDEQFQAGGTPPLDASYLQRTGSFDSMTNNFVGTMGMPVGQGCPPMVHTMVQFVPMAMPGPVMWDGAPFPASGKELEEMLKQAMPTHYDD